MKTNNTPKKFHKNNLHGFTLVELIVVITILVILGTIAFTSLTGYSGNARDSSRVSDIINVSKGLDIAYVKTGSYPNPDSSFSVTYSGGLLWTQGVVGDTVVNILGSAGAKMSKKPMDPLVSTKEYVYSKLAFWNAYQLKADWEGDSIAFSPSHRFLANVQNRIYEQANAATGNPTLAYLNGNFGGVIARTQTGSMNYIIAVPSIISGTGTSGWTVKIDVNNTLSWALIVHKGSNTVGINYNPNTKVVFSGANLPVLESDRRTLATNIANAYSGTVIATNSQIQTYISAVASGNNTVLTALGNSAAVSVGGGVTLPTNNTVTSAACGSSHNSTGSTAPTTNLCGTNSTLSGTTVSGSWPWTWTCNSTNGGSSASCTQYSNLVNGSCTGLPSNALYTNSTTSYSLVNALNTITLSAVTAGYNASPTSNTCEWKCGSGYQQSGNSCVEAPLYTFSSHTFTNCGTTGQTGPSLATCRSLYSTTWDENTSYFSMTVNGIQEWTVPVTGVYTIVARGAQGWNGGSYIWGVWAIMQWDMTLTKGEKIRILAWQYGNSSYGWGGGGTFVTKSDNTPLVVAGWGGTTSPWWSGAIPALIWTSGGAATNGSNAGGTAGGGGSANVGAPGGAGLTGNGQAASCQASFPYSFTNGGVGSSSAGWGRWGFGGGAATDDQCYGQSWAGGGYSWGGSSTTSGQGGGGWGSYNAWANQSNSVWNTGNGSVTITKL